MRQKKSRFTLIELLVVIGIASVLLGMLAPAFHKMIFGSKVDQCASNFKLGLELAQSRAVTARKYVAMVIPPHYANDEDDENPERGRLKKFCNGGFRLAYVKKDTSDSTKWQFIDWIPDDEWRNPIDGAMLVKITKTKPTDATATSGLTEDADKNFSLDSDILHPLTETANIEDLKNIAGLTPNKTNNPGALIFSPYGGLAEGTLTLYFVFTEAKITDDIKYSYDNLDNYLALKLNPITGRVTYLPQE